MSYLPNIEFFKNEGAGYVLRKGSKIISFTEREMRHLFALIEDENIDEDNDEDRETCPSCHELGWIEMDTPEIQACETCDYFGIIEHEPGELDSNAKIAHISDHFNKG